MHIILYTADDLLPFKIVCMHYSKISATNIDRNFNQSVCACVSVSPWVRGRWTEFAISQLHSLGIF